MTKKQLQDQNEQLLVAIESMYGMIKAVVDPMGELVETIRRVVRDGDDKKCDKGGR